MLTKRIYHRVSVVELDVDLRSRDAIIELQSLVHNQLSCSLFKPMISYAWSTCGYIPKQYSNFSSVISMRTVAQIIIVFRTFFHRVSFSLIVFLVYFYYILYLKNCN